MYACDQHVILKSIIHSTIVGTVYTYLVYTYSYYRCISGKINMNNMLQQCKY